MKAAPKVDTDGFFIDDAIVDDAFNGVVPFYADPPAQEPGLPPETDPQAADDHPEETPEPEVAGYIVGVPVPSGLFHPRFNLAAWNEDSSQDPDAYWIEGLTPEEIEKLKQPAHVVTPELVLAAESVRRELEVLELKQQNAALGTQVVEQELTINSLKAQYEALGKSLVTLELKLLEVTTTKGGGDE